MRHKLFTGRLVVIIFLFFSLLFMGFSVVIAQQTAEEKSSRAMTIAVTEVNGNAQILPGTEVGKSRGQPQILADAWRSASPKTGLNQGDQLRTGANASMKLQLNDGTLVSLSGDTLLVVEDLRSARGDAPQTIQFKLEKGTISTQQTVKILGQTNQIIRTDNGAVNTRMAEVEVQRAGSEATRDMKIAALPESPRKLEKGDKTTVILRRGTADIESTGTGQITTTSLVLPETCQGNDGIQFTLRNPKAKVSVSRLEEENAFQLSSQEKFQLLVGTEGSANTIAVSTQGGDGVVDVEGITIAELRADAFSVFQLNELLTLGVMATNLKVKLSCDENASRGLDQIGVQSMAGDVNILRTNLGMTGTDRPDPSRGLRGAITPTPVPGMTPTPTPTPGPGEEIPTPTPTPAILTGPTQQPQPTPVTHTFPQEPTITGISVNPVLNGYLACSGANDYSIEVTVNFDNYLPTIIGGRLFSRETNDLWTPLALFQYPIPDPNTGSSMIPNLTMTAYNYTWPMEQGQVRYWFCYIPPVALAPNVYFQVYMRDSAGNVSTTRNCSGPVTGGITCP